MKRILVTGSSGTVGTRLCEALLEKKIPVVGIDLKRNMWSEAVDKITVKGDLRDEKVFKKLGGNFDMVVHLAANARVYNLVEKPELAKDNCDTTINVLEFCRKNKIRKVIFSSSREVYGNSGKLVYSEDDADMKGCESPYTASKVAGEAFVHAYSKCYGIDYIIMRFSNVYGMYDDSDRVVPLFIRLLMQNKGLVVFGENKLLDFTYIDDTINGVMACIERFESAKKDVYNIATGEGIRILDVAKALQKELGKGTKIEVKGNRTGEVVTFIADISRAREKLGFEPKVQFPQGIRRSVEWYSKKVYGKGA